MKSNRNLHQTQVRATRNLYTGSRDLSRNEERGLETTF